MSEPCSCRDCERVFQWGDDADSALVDEKSCRENAYWKLNAHVLAEHRDLLMRCPRRGESAMGLREAGNVDFWRGSDAGCSYCGSMSPADFFAAVEVGEPVGPTDKSYKAYVGGAHKKFYFQHLSKAEQDRFIDLYNQKKMKIGFPGHFYSRPFFCSPVAKSA